LLIPWILKIISPPYRIHLQEASLKLEKEINSSKPFPAEIDASLRRPAIGALVVAVLLTIFLGLSSWRTIRLAADEADLVVHTYAVMDTLEVTSRHLTEAEGGTLAFALAAPEALLPRSEIWKSTIALDEETLRHLTADNPNQQRRLDVLEPQVRAALELAESLVAKRRLRRLSPARQESCRYSVSIENPPRRQ
jgi:CHASE3 domain sensor protein